MHLPKNRSITVDVLLIIFAISSWISSNGVFVELPVLVEKLPEGWALPSYLGLIIHAGNIGTLLFVFIRKQFPERVNETCATYIFLTVGLVASFMTIFFWDKTLVINSKNHSLGLFILIFAQAVMDCASPVVFLPFAALFKPQYMITYMVGEGLSGFLPAIVALVQGVGGNPECKNVTFINYTLEGNYTQWRLETLYSEPRFSVEVFFGVEFALICAAAIAFVLLNVLQVAKDERDGVKVVDTIKTSENILMTSTSSIHPLTEPVNSPVLHNSKMDYGQMKTFTYWYILMSQTISCLCIYGILLSIQSYSCLPYGNLGYHLAITLSNVAAPFASFVAIFIVPVSVTVVTIHLSITAFLGAYIFTLAVMSPYPPLLNSDWGSPLMVVAWIICMGTFFYARTGMVNIMRSQGTRAVFWLGVANQVGGVIGSTISFLLVSHYDVFKSYDPCA